MRNTESRPGTGPEVIEHPGEPALIEVAIEHGAAVDWLRRHRTAIRSALLKHGHLLVRGLGLDSEQAFAAARDELVDHPADHPREETTKRSSYGNGVFSATDLPPTQTIRLHNEDSYSVVFPGLLMFCCLTAADTGGATTVCDSRRVLAALPVELVERFRRVGWIVTRTFNPHIGISWQETFGTDDPDAVQEYCVSHQVGVEWLPDGRLRTAGRRPALVHHPVTGDEVWFNHVAVFNEWTHDPETREVLIEAFGHDGLPQNTFYGDGSPLDPADAGLLNRVYDEATIAVQWQRGDLLLVDNILSSHGRLPYTGMRKVLVSMGDPRHVDECTPGGAVGAAPTTYPGAEQR